MSEEPRTTRLPGAPEPRRVRAFRLEVQSPGAPLRQLTFDTPVVRAGTQAHNELVLEDPSVSRIHAEIAQDAFGFRLTDRGSTNGTFVDGMRVNDVYLQKDARIFLGRTQLVFTPLAEEKAVPASTHQSFGPLLGKSHAMRELYLVLERLAQSDATVLIEGESGTGKELCARALHQAGSRAGGPYVVFDCASVSGALIESELFGHEKGSFTGAEARRQGCLEESHGGTLFLDEIGELPRELQPKLLRALENREFRRVGGNRAQKLDVRIVAATHRDLAAEVNRGTFREDLYYRLAVTRVRLPSLRERREDIPLLVEHFVRAELGAEQAAQFLAGEPLEDWEQLASHPWPGNVRELRNVVARALALRQSGLARQLGPGPTRPPPETKDGAAVELPFIQAREEVLERFERSYLEGVLARCGGNLSKAAAAAGLDRAYFRRLLRKRRSS